MKITEKDVDELINKLLYLFEEADIEINTKLTLFAKVQRTIYNFFKFN